MQPYVLTDRKIKFLNYRAVGWFADAKQEMRKLPFDELNIFQIVNNLYRELDLDNYTIFTDLAILSYQQAEPHGDIMPDMNWVSALLLAYDPVTKYVYQHEVERKRARLAEALIAVGKAQCQQNEEWRRGLSLWAQQTAQYADIVTDAAMIKAFADSGITKLRWVTQEDEKVCKICRERDGKVYPITDLPDKPHWHCRCYWAPVIGN